MLILAVPINSSPRPLLKLPQGGGVTVYEYPGMGTVNSAIVNVPISSSSYFLLFTLYDSLEHDFITSSLTSGTAYPGFIGIVDRASLSAYGLFLNVSTSSTSSKWDGIEYGTRTGNLFKTFYKQVSSSSSSGKYSVDASITNTGICVEFTHSGSTYSGNGIEFRAVYKEL